MWKVIFFPCSAYEMPEAHFSSTVDKDMSGALIQWYTEEGGHNLTTIALWSKSEILLMENPPNSIQSPSPFLPFPVVDSRIWKNRPLQAPLLVYFLFVQIRFLWATPSS